MCNCEISVVPILQCTADCTIPKILRGAWFSWENGRNTLTELDANSMTNYGYCYEMRDDFHQNYTFVFKDDCYTCVKFLVRTVNVVEKIECMLSRLTFSFIFKNRNN